MTQEQESPIHLREVLGTENKHQTTLHGTVTMHVPQRLDIMSLVLFKLLLEASHLSVQVFYGIIEVRQVDAHSLNATFLVFNLRVEHHQVLKSALHVLLISTQPCFLLSYLLLYF